MTLYIDTTNKRIVCMNSTKAATKLKESKVDDPTFVLLFQMNAGTNNDRSCIRFLNFDLLGVPVENRTILTATEYLNLFP